ncbi:hypothetical protein [Clostridium saudiense]|uniref:hypothetical protein n=1 Tax=Clostridium saudiense TaxID=1414720 RepID=UPI00266EBE96|nr:hypothetical protein [Clostridium saudiense]
MIQKIADDIFGTIEENKEVEKRIEAIEKGMEEKEDKLKEYISAVAFKNTSSIMFNELNNDIRKNILTEIFEELVWDSERRLIIISKK